MRSRVLVGVLLVLTGGVAIRAAQDDPVPEPVEAKLRYGSLSLYSENDVYFAGTDRHYTNGLKLSWLSTDLNSLEEKRVPAPLRWIARSSTLLIDPTSQPKVGFSLGQNFYTPVDITTTAYIPGDRPYAAWLYLGGALHNYIPAGRREDGTRRHARLHVLEVNLGVVGGSAALGEFVQNHWHDLLGIARARGWDNQLHNELGLNITYETRWRFSAGDPRSSWGADLIPQAAVCLGNVNTNAGGGAEVRFGYRIPADFGTSLIRPSSDTNATERPPFSIFVFGMAVGRAVARDITLDGNTFRDSPSVDREPLVADVAAGIGVGWHRLQVTYTQAQRSREFRTQTQSQVFGSLNFSVSF